MNRKKCIQSDVSFSGKQMSPEGSIKTTASLNHQSMSLVGLGLSSERGCGDVNGKPACVSKEVFPEPFCPTKKIQGRLSRNNQRHLGFFMADLVIFMCCRICFIAELIAPDLSSRVMRKPSLVRRPYNAF